MQHINRSEVSRLKAQFELEHAAAQYALYGLSSGTLKHQVITSKMERMGMLQEDLQCLIGERRATRFVVKTMNYGPSSK